MVLLAVRDVLLVFGAEVASDDTEALACAMEDAAPSLFKYAIDFRNLSSKSAKLLSLWAW